MTLVRVFSTFAGLMLAGLGVLVFWTGPIVEAGGIEMFDTRTGGYDLATAREILRSLDDAARSTYLVGQRIADTVFPIGLLGTLSLGLVLALRRWSLAAALALTLVPAAYFVFDMLENAGVARMILAGPEGITGAQVERVAGFTLWKFRFVNAAFVLFALAWIARLGAWGIAARTDRRRT